MHATCMLAMALTSLMPAVAAGLVTIGCPAAAPPPATTVVSDVTIDTGARPLGAYTLALTYDPAVVVVVSIGGGATAEFSSPPIVNPADFASGRTRLLAFNSASLTSPTGTASVARVTFNVIGLPGSSTPLAVEIITLADTDGIRIASETAGCTFEVATTITPTASPVPTQGLPTATPHLTPTATPTSAATPTHTVTRTPAMLPTHTPTPMVTDTPLAASCSGDCNRDGAVTVDELLRGVNIALGNQQVDECPSFDRTGDGMITVDEIIFATKLALDGCPSTPTPTSTRTSTPSPTPTPTATPTPTMTPTPTVNHPPVVPRLTVYHAYTGHEIRRAIGAADPDGGELHYRAENLPRGAELDAATGVLSWTPQADQVGPRYVPFTCIDDGSPPLSAEGLLVFQVSPFDACTTPACDPASGCQSSPVPIGADCCAEPPRARLAQPLASCPEGRVLFVGRNNSGFGRLQNCDRLWVINFLQAGASVRFHVEARCVNAAQPVTVRARLETKTRLLFDLAQAVILDPSSDGYARKVPVVFPVVAPGPFYDFEGAEAQLAVTLTDADGVVVQEQLRVTLTFDVLDDLPETVDVPPP